jgi:hypothetical protein
MPTGQELENGMPQCIYIAHSRSSTKAQSRIVNYIYATLGTNHLIYTLSLTIPLLMSLVPNVELLAHQFAFNLVKGSATTSWKVFAINY